MTAPGPDWFLIRRIARLVAEPRFGGGLRREELARQLGMREWDPRLRQALGIAYRNRMVDFVGYEYVVAPTWPAAPAAAEQSARRNHGSASQVKSGSGGPARSLSSPVRRAARAHTSRRLLPAWR